ncbi:chemotaxis protein CheR [Pseudomonas sp. LS1212]|uniref:CheR family methyltransferase n=1 Tax=Pseudomonas sp. LS1212 TaxID=2972478 RepID=UPI00215C4E75|nr:CheR family methyltransferase [Pseudomonas sp. LS1212]UVJ45097.1 chemotaxis protein CheR [Pseudomonas sp. LS1212]
MNHQQRFFRFLQDRIGLDATSVGAAMIERAVRQRCTAAQARDLDDYWLMLQQSAPEQQALIEAVIVPETWFFRYPESFTALARLASARLGELNGERPLRILSLPCSSGEEPYSIAMTLLDAGIAAHQFKVEGIDVSPHSIERASRGLYGRNSFRGARLDFRERHFTVQAEDYLLSEPVRKQVQLRVGNVLDPALLAGGPTYDFVFCRNLLIYFDVPTQQRVFGVLKALTAEPGVLFIGPAEGSLLARLGMRPLGIAQSFAFVRRSEPAAIDLPTRLPISPPPRLLPAVHLLPQARSQNRSVPLRAAVAEPAEVIAGAQQAATLLGQIATLANEGKSREARTACELYLQQHAPDAQVFYWLGLLSDGAGNALEAQVFYRKALYLQPQHPEALAHLAVLLASRGDMAGARRLQERAARSERAAESERKR